jgi:hypothetical protein
MSIDKGPRAVYAPSDNKGEKSRRATRVLYYWGLIANFLSERIYHAVAKLPASPEWGWGVNKKLAQNHFIFNKI